MKSQKEIEKEAGIDSRELAAYISSQQTAACRDVVHFLAIQIDSQDPGGMEMLKQAVAECKKELEKLYDRRT